jgi:hypothetical protein
MQKFPSDNGMSYIKSSFNPFAPFMLASFVVLSLAGCSSKPALEGEWSVVEWPGSAEEFNGACSFKNGNVSMSANFKIQNFGLGIFMKGTYVVDGEKLTITPSDAGVIPGREAKAANVARGFESAIRSNLMMPRIATFKLQGDTAVLEFPDGDWKLARKK